MDGEKIFEEVKRLEELDEKKMNDKEKKEFEEKRQGFLDILAMMAAVNKEKSKEEAIAKTMAHIFYNQYSAFVREGFSPEQAMDLVKCLILGVSANDVLKK